MVKGDPVIFTKKLPGGGTYNVLDGRELEGIIIECPNLNTENPHYKVKYTSPFKNYSYSCNVFPDLRTESIRLDYKRLRSNKINNLLK